jgi:long-chain acyl-CoA synthetase
MTETSQAPAEARSPATRRTIALLWRDAIAAQRQRPAYLVEQDGGGWREMSWSEADERVRAYANGLLALGVRKGDTFALLARNGPEWALLDYAFARIGAVGVPIYASSSQKDVQYLLEHSEAVGVVCEDAEQLAKVSPYAAELDRLEHVLTYADLPGLAERGRAFAGESPSALDDASDAIEEDDLFTIIYTSGTTGPPKGCMISHRNYYAMASVADEMESHYRADDVMLLYLPLAHNFGRLMHLSGAYVGFTIAFLADPLRVADAMLEVRPTVLPSVPRVFEKVHTAVQARFAEATGVKRRLIDWALPIGREVSRLEAAGKPVPRGLALRHRLADRLVFAKVRERLGGRLRLPISGGAPLAPEISEFFDGIGVRVMEGYGLTECTTAASTNRPERYRFGTVGPPLPGFEIRTDDDGEILVRSETVFQGYFKDPEATAEVLTDDGWLRTGDIGELDDDGFLKITDRKKDILVTAGGKNVAPQNLENDLKTSRYLSQALVVGDRRPYVAALVTLDPDEIRRWAAEHGIDGDPESLARDERVRALVQGIVDEVNRERSRYEQIKRFAIPPRDFTMEAGEVTPTLKLRRRAVIEHFQAEIDELYAS